MVNMLSYGSKNQNHNELNTRHEQNVFPFVVKDTPFD